MHDAHIFLKALATVLCVAAVTTVLFQRLRLPAVLGYVLAGIIVGPYLPVPIVADRSVVHALSELGVILLMFSLGLEFSLRKLVKVGPTAGLIMVLEVSFMIWLGYLTGRLLGWNTIESIFAGAIVSISSTMVIAKSFSELRPERAHVELVFGVLVFEDLMAILLLAALTALSVGSLSAATLVSTLGRLGAFLIGLLVFGLLLIPRLVRLIARLGSDETLLVACVGLCFGVSLLAQAVGYSVALGAFISGSLVAESGEGKRIEHLVHPVRDLFGAVFFVSVGMSIDPSIIAQYWFEGMVLTIVVVVGKIIGVSLGSFLTGHSIRASIQTAMTLAQIGEFSFIIASVGVAQQATGKFMYPIAVAVSAVTALTTPLLMRASGRVATFVDRRLPRSLQTFATLYASWVEQLRTQPVGRGKIRQLVRLVLIDDICLAGLTIGASLSMSRLAPVLERAGGLTPILARVAVVALTLALSVPFWVGMVRSARRLGAELALRALPAAPEGQVDLSAAPRRALTVTLQILVMALSGAPLLAITQPFLPSVPGALGAVLWLALIGLMGITFWRSANNLLGHVRAGAEAVVEVLAAQGMPASADSDPGAQSGAHAPGSLPPVTPPPGLQTVLSGLGSWTTERIEEGEPCVGKTLAELKLRGLTGATVLAIQRKDRGVAAPGANEVLGVGDVVVLAGSAESIERARRLLREATTEDLGASYELFSISHT